MPSFWKSLLPKALLVALGLAAVAEGQALRTHYPRLGEISFNPVLRTVSGNPRLSEHKHWFNPATEVYDFMDGMQQGSHGLVKLRLNYYLEMDFWPVKADGFQYTEAQYLGNNWHMPDGVDYATIIRNYDLARKVDRGELDEVAINGGPYFGYWETTMAGYNGFWCNSGPQPNVACSRIFVITGWNYERITSLHATGHRCESIMSKVYNGWDVNGDRTIWDRFGWNHGQTTISGNVYGIGSAHLPANANDHYDYANPQWVSSYAPAWMNDFPAFNGKNGATSLVSRSTWGFTPNSYEMAYFIWWYQHMPHVAGTNSHDGYTRLNNWWEYLYNFNEHAPSNGDHRLGGAVPTATPYPADLTAVTAANADQWAPVVNPAGRVVWYGWDGNDFEIYSANADGSDFVQITNNNHVDEAPAINAAGQIVWQSFNGRSFDIFTANADGTGVVRITNNQRNNWHPDISDSGRIVWEAWDGEDYEIFSANADGTDIVQITNNSHGGGLGPRRDDVWPRINVHNRVVWSGHDGNNFQIFSANADGTGLVKITNNNYQNEYPQISDGGMVVWHAWLSGNITEIYSANADGTNVRRLTANSVRDWWPQVNTRGDVIWMERTSAGDWELVMRYAGSNNNVFVTANSQHDQYPRIDDFGRIFWQGFDGNDWEIYCWDNGVLYQVTDNDYDDRWPQLSGTGITVWHAESGTSAAGPTTEIVSSYYGGTYMPLAYPDAMTTRMNVPMRLSLRGLSASGSPLTFRITALPTGGELVDPAAGSIGSVPYALASGQREVWYYPNPGFGGSDSFTFRVNDGRDSQPATVTLAVTGTNAPDGDVDRDGRVGQIDAAAFSECVSGPGALPSPAAPWRWQDCLYAFDFDTDSDVDLEDFRTFQTLFVSEPRIYVRQGASGANDGTSWTDAYVDLQDAMEAAANGSTIWVAGGTYRPDRGTSNPLATFQLKDGVSLYGGFAGNETSLEERDLAANPTVLSGDLGGENSYHVVYANGVDQTAVVDGFVITGGDADGVPNDHNGGGGARIAASRVTLRNCVIRGNKADLNGGGILNNQGSVLTLINCVISGNTATNRGGGVQAYQSTVTATNCTIVHNRSGTDGGGIFVNEADLTATNCIFWSNTAQNGALSNQNAQIFWASGMVDINYCCVRLWTGSLGGVGNNGQDPRFVDADGPDNVPGTADDDLRLSAGSGCIDSGDNTVDTDATTPGHQPLPLIDAAGGPRFLDDPYTADTGVGTPPIVDRGAYEYQP